MPHICVPGAVFVGLATAVRLQEEANVDVTVVAKAFRPGYSLQWSRWPVEALQPGWAAMQQILDQAG